MSNIGKKIKALREEAGFSQEKLAELLEVSRPTLSNIENGERHLRDEELVELARIFNTSSDYILGLRDKPQVTLQRGKSKTKKAEMRIDVPQENVRIFKNILLYILNKVGAKANVGETVIYKLLYFIDFDFYEKYEEQLMGAKYIKNTYGPTPVEFQKIVKQMIEDEEIEKVSSNYYQYPQTKYLPRKTEDRSALDARGITLIDDVLNRLSGKSASDISEYSHGDVPWMGTDEGEVIEYESVFYRTPAYSVREACDAL